MQPSLYFSERLIISFFLSLLVLFTVVAKISSWKVQKTLAQIVPSPSVFVEVSGEVMRPGVYELKERATIGDLLERARPKRFADLSRIDLDASLPSALSIPRLAFIQVAVAGEGVEAPVVLEVEPGTRIDQLKSKIRFAQDADLSFFRSRRMAVHGEEILVGKRK